MFAPQKNSKEKIAYYWPLLIVAAAIIFYIPAIQSGFIWDDDAHVFLNPHLFEQGGLWRIWFTQESQQYYPFVYSSFWLEYRFWGATPAGYHIVNVLLHSANAILVYLIVRRITPVGALAAAFIFLLHPVNVESVAWVSERKNVLSALFYLSALHCFLKNEEMAVCGKSGSNIKWYALAFLFFIFALLSKTVTSSLPVALIIIHWMRGEKVTVRYLCWLLPFFIIGAVFGLLTVWWEAHHVGASGAEWEMATLERAVLPARSLWFYLAKLALPLKLTFIYPRFELDPARIWQWFFTFGFLILATLLYFLRRVIGRAPIAALAFFSITLFPALGFIDVYPFRYSFVADHFQYLATIGPIALVSVLVARALKAQKQAAAILALVVVLILGALTWSQAGSYKDLETLWRDVLRKNPSAWIAHNNLGEILYKRGEKVIAIDHYREAARLWPRSREARYNLASSLYEAGEFEEAERNFLEVLTIRPDFAEAIAGLALVLADTGRMEAAISAAREAVIMRPDSPAVQNSIGNVMVKASRYSDALSHYNAALSLDPASTETLNNIGVVLSALGQYALAIESFERAIEMDASYSEARYNLAVTLVDIKRYDDAAAQYRETIRLSPAHAQAYNNLGNLYYKEGKLKEAIAEYKEAIRIRPDFTEAHGNLKFVTSELEKKK